MYDIIFIYICMIYDIIYIHISVAILAQDVHSFSVASCRFCICCHDGLVRRCALLGHLKISAPSEALEKSRCVEVEDNHRFVFVMPVFGTCLQYDVGFTSTRVYSGE